MKKKGKKVLIHCKAGMSRSAAFTIAYFMKSKGLSYKDAYLLVKKKRVCVKPNDGFVKQLLEYEQIIQK